MPIHTIECTKQISKSDFDNLCIKIKKSYPSKWSRLSENILIFHGLKHLGIIIKFKHILSPDVKKYFITYQLSLYRLFEQDNFVDLFNSNHFQNYALLFNSLIKKISNDFPEIKETKLTRADMAFNYLAGNENDAQQYLKIIQRGMVPKTFKLGGSYDPVGKRWKPYQDSFYLKSPGTRISIYNKYVHMSTQTKGTFPKREIERSKGIIRVEIQIYGDKMKYLSQKYDFSSTEEFFEIEKDVEGELFLKYLSQIMGRGEVLTLFEAKKTIRHSLLKASQKEIMEELVEKANLYRNAKLAIEELKLKYGEKKIKKALENFDSIGVSFVTMPHRAAQQFDWFYQPFQAYTISART